MFWSDIDYVVPLLSRIISEDSRMNGHNRTWTVDTFHAENDDMVGVKGRQWFDNCWLPGRSSTSSSRRDSPDVVQQSTYGSYEYRSEVVKGADHNYLMDPVFGASDVWFKRVRDAIPRPAEVWRLLLLDRTATDLE
jgi:hypothetical protein